MLLNPNAKNAFKIGDERGEDSSQSIGLGECAGIVCFKLFGSFWTVNKTSLYTVLLGIVNAAVPMDKVNIAVFGSYEEIINPTPFTQAEVDDEGFHDVRFYVCFSDPFTGL